MDTQVTSYSELDRPKVPNLPSASSLPFFVGVDDTLRFVTFSSLAGLTVTLSGLMLNDQGQLVPFQLQSVPGSGRVEAGPTQEIGEGWIAHFSFTVTGGSPRRGQLYAEVRIVRGSQTPSFQHAVLFSGYITKDFTPGFPGIRSESPLDGQGMPRFFATGNPAAGADFSQTVPAGARWQIQTVTATLVTSAVAGTRNAVLSFDDAVNLRLQVPPAATQAPSLTRTYYWSLSVTNTNDTVANIILTQMPPLFMFQGDRVRAITNAIDVGDQWSNVRFSVVEWLEL